MTETGNWAHRGLAAALVLLWAWGVCLGAGPATEIAPALKVSKVPEWDARGLGALPRQGVACVDMSDDGRFVAVGTIAAPGDPSVLLLDADGKLMGSHRAGLRWINEVMVWADGRFMAALCTTPAGTSGDSPRLFAFLDGKEIDQVSARFRFEQFRPEMYLFHYGDHSNHIARVAGRSARHWVVVGDDQVRWLSPREGTVDHAASLRQGVTTAMAVAASGRVVVGRLVEMEEGPDRAAGLVVADPNGAGLAWTRPAAADVSRSPQPEKGVYGPAVGPYRDMEVRAPLAVSVSDRGGRVATADYQGWRRVLTAVGGGTATPIGLRFMPSRPTIHIHHADGKLLRRLGGEAFAEPFWCDLAFTGDGRRLLIWPHNWTSRGLGGVGILPADAKAHTLYALDVESGAMASASFPDAVAAVDSGGALIAVGCWDGRVYLLDERLRPAETQVRGVDAGAACLVRVSRDGRRILAAGVDGIVRMLDGRGGQVWRTDLNAAVPRGEKPWTLNQRADKLAEGLWRTNGGLAHSDMGAQFVIQAPRGLLLIDPSAGASFEQNCARIKAAGLDPMQVRYVLLTHEHGDHAPGAYLWRVVTGAEVVAGAETAYILRHHIPGGTGYGFHPPVPVDRAVSEDGELDLAGLKVRALRLPGHTYGSMGWAFGRDGRTYVATGDLVMPGGVLGYSGSMDFSAADVLASLRKLREPRPDAVLGGHGGGPPDQFIDAGIEAGVATGWGRMPPEKPDPLHRFNQRNYLVVGWLAAIQSMACGDVDGDGRADVAVLVPAGRGSKVLIYLNKGGSFAAAADVEVAVPSIAPPWKLRLTRINGDKAADFLVSCESAAAVALSRDGRLDCRMVPLPGISRASQVLTGDFNADGRMDVLVGSRFAAGVSVGVQLEDGTFRVHRTKEPQGPYFDVAAADVDGDEAEDLIASTGEVFLRQAGGGLAETPTWRLAPPRGDQEGWAFMAAADFNRDGWTDVALLSNSKAGSLVRMYLNTRGAARPFADPPAAFTIPGALVLRDGPTTADWNGDGVADLVLAMTAKARGGACILLGDGRDGLSANRRVEIALDYTPHHDTKLAVADLNGDGRADLVGHGPSPTGAVGVYAWLQPAAPPQGQPPAHPR